MISDDSFAWGRILGAGAGKSKNYRVQEAGFRVQGSASQGRHPRESGDPVARPWIPAFAGMTTYPRQLLLPASCSPCLLNPVSHPLVPHASADQTSSAVGSSLPAPRCRRVGRQYGARGALPAVSGISIRGETTTSLACRRVSPLLSSPLRPPSARSAWQPVSGSGSHSMPS